MVGSPQKSNQFLLPGKRHADAEMHHVSPNIPVFSVSNRAALPVRSPEVFLCGRREKSGLYWVPVLISKRDHW
jgi:hypothetical protein